MNSLRTHIEKRLTIRSHLLILLLALALPFLAFLVISSGRQAHHDREVAAQQMLGVARLTAARLDDHVGDIRQLLSVLSAVVGPELADTARNDALLLALKTRLPPQINNLTVWTLDGRNAGTMNPALRIANIDVSQRTFFRQATEGSELAIEGPVASVSNGKMIGIFALPVERDGRVVAVVAASAQLGQLQNLLAPPGTAPAASVITVTDISGVVLARSIDPDKWIGKNILSGANSVADSLKRREGVSDGPSADGIPRIAGFTMARRVPWLVYVGIPTEVALAPVRIRLYENIAAGAAMLVVGLLLAAWVGQRISVPLQELAADAEALERGELTHRSRVRHGGEIGVLASTLNRMAEALQQRTASLEASQNRLRQLAEHDALTGLPNRTLFLDRLNVAISRATRQHAPLALLFLDIDHFKVVNDTLGHEAGDALLVAFAQRLKGAVRQSDTVARLAGDEFTIVLEAIRGPDEARRIAETLLESSRRAVGPDGRSAALSTSIGLAMFEPGETAASLLRRADEALYAAKAAGRDRCCCTPLMRLPAAVA